MMLSTRLRAQLGMVAAGCVFLAAISIVVAGALEKPLERVGLPGSPAASFRLPDLNGQMISLASLRDNVVVLCFNPAPTNTLSIADANRLAQLGKKYNSASDGVKLVQIYTGTDETSPDDMRQVQSRANDAGPHCLTLLDPTSRIAQRYSIADTPTFLVIDPAGVIRYRGGIDDTSADAPLAATSFTSMIDLLLAEKPLPGVQAPALLSNLK